MNDRQVLAELLNTLQTNNVSKILALYEDKIYKTSDNEVGVRMISRHFMRNIGIFHNSLEDLSEFAAIFSNEITDTYNVVVSMINDLMSRSMR